MSKICNNCGCEPVCINANPFRTVDCKFWKPQGDAVEVVRCRDCESWHHIGESIGECKNERFHIPGVVVPCMGPNDFCSCGKKRDQQ